MEAGSSELLDQYRSQFFHSTDAIHLNNAGQTLMCRPAYETLVTWAKKFCELGAHSYPPLAKELEVARFDVARFLGCEASELVFFPGAAGAISQVALGMKFSAGDEIIVWDQEYPSSFYPWKVAAERTGARVIVAKSGNDLSTPVESIRALTTERTKVIAVSWVQFRTGAVTDIQALAAFARPRGIFTCVDVIQGVGCLPFNFREMGIDAACGGAHKWLTAAHGAGFMALRQEHFRKLDPLMVGAMTYGTPDDPTRIEAEMKVDVNRFEPGSKGFLEILALASATRLLERTGMEKIAATIEDASRYLCEGLSEMGYEIHSPHGDIHRGGIVNFGAGDRSPLRSTDAIVERLSSKRVSYAIRPPGVRLSPAAYNTREEINLVLRHLSVPQLAD